MSGFQTDKYHSAVRQVAFHFLEGRDFAGVLDVGGGYGNTAAAIKERYGASSVGVVDLVASLDSCNPALDFAVAGDLSDPALIEELGREHGPFQVILCMDVLEHLADPWGCVQALGGLLRPDGVLIASIPNVAHLSVSAKLFLLGEWKLYPEGILDRTHLRFFTRQTAKELLECGGLKVDGVTSTMSPIVYWRYVNWLRHFGLSRRLAYQYVMAARRAA